MTHKTVMLSTSVRDKIRIAEVDTNDQLDITEKLEAWNKGDAQALSDVIQLVYYDLRDIARRHVRRSVTPVAQSGTLVHEAYLKLLNTRGIRCNNRAHFFALCSQMIRRILVDHARKRGTAKRDEGLQVPLDEALLGSRARGIKLEALDDALNKLARVDPRKARVVELRFFGGLSVLEAAEILEISEETAARDWRVAKTWLFRELSRAD
jgi:RNA polymerase sigma factor (TIGR02999 family)